MSDSDDFGGLAPTTPLPPQKRKAATGRSEKPPSNRATAGPSNSNKPPSNTANGNARKKAKTTGAAAKKVQEEEDDAGEDSDVREILVNTIEEETEDGNDDEEVQELPPPKQQRGGSKKPESGAGRAATSTGASSKAKGKQKASIAVQNGKRAVKKNGEEAEGMDVDAEENEEDIMEVDGPTDLAATNKAGNGKAAAANGGGKKGATSNPSRPNAPPAKNNPSRQEAKLATENARLKEEVERLKGHIDDLKTKFDDLMNTRLTEPENLMEEMAHNHERELNVHKSIIKDLQTELGKKDPLLRSLSGKKAHAFALVSRDEADEEAKEYKATIHHLRNEVTAAKHAIASKDEEIANLKQVEQDLRFELKAEVQRSEQLSKQNRNPPGSATRGGSVLKGDDPKHTQVISLYEDLTNILVPTVKCNPAPYGEEWIFTCIYTWKDEMDTTVPEKSLNFSLRACKEVSADDASVLVDSVHYHPMSLEMESQEFVDNLGFLSKPFSFPKPQLALFVRTLYDNLNGTQDDDE
ncbi:hypothetical protein D9611_004866 [Ephemerocybe angulata]|uniref:Monopolin complex subunit Csm1/Pcs1 C-terminal domain-containing protein n=1 Tax=Ephemerocybe angulata TaxID=980116 RepID=A0A8H5B2T6_9AGAR|nr:hypothetical protein D9611_004866 [Tulosesus angulatus]